MQFQFHSKPSAKTLRLIKERSELEKKSIEIPTLYTAPKVKPVLIQDHDQRTVNELENLKKEYIEMGGNDPKIWQEFQNLDMIKSNVSQGRISEKLVSEKLVIEEKTGRQTPKNSLKSLQNRQIQHDLDMMELDFQRERLIAEHELKELKLDLETAVIVPKKLKLSIVPYNPYLGFHIRWHEIIGLHLSLKQQVCITFALFDGEKSIRKVNQVTLHSVLLNHDSYFLDVPMKPTIRCIVDVRLGSNNSMIPLGWTMIDIFNQKRTVDCGSWRSPLYQHPILFDINAARSGKLVEKEQSLAYHLYDHSQCDELGNIDNVFSYKQASTEERWSELEPTPISATLPKLLPPLPNTGPLKQTVDQKESKRKRRQEEVPKAKEERVSVEEKQEEQGKKYPIGFHLTEIREFRDGDYCSVRLIIVDDNIKTVAFVTDKSEPSEQEDSHGWSFGYFFEIPGLVGLPNRKGLFELLKSDRVVGTCEFDVFKFHFSQPFGIIP